MSNISICRVCLKGNTKTHSILNSPLQLMYEKLTNNKLHTEDGRPETVCSFCLWKLSSCCKFKEKSEKSGEILKQLSTHGIEIIPETLSVMKRGIQLDFCVTPIDSFDYGNQYEKLIIKEEIKSELEPALNASQEGLGADAKLCRVCLSVSTRTFNQLGQAINSLYEKITNTKLSLTAPAQVLCYICRARLQRCRELVSNASRSEKIIAELARNGIQLSQETVNILNRKIKSRISGSRVEIFSYNPEDTKSVIIKDDKQRKAVTTSIESIIKQELDGNYEELDQNCDEIGQSYEEPGQNYDEPGQTDDEPDQSSDGLGQRCNINQSATEIVQNYGNLGECKVCKAKLNSQEKVERHKRLHDPRRKYACNRCTYRYEIKSHLNFHKKTHVYNNKCKVCGKGFANMKLLKRHMWLHSGNIYKCRICDAIFRYGHEIAKHNLSEHPDVNYDCKFCQQPYTAEHRLFEHVFRDHARDFPYHTCEHCRKRFTDLHTLSKHMIIVHLKSFKHKCVKCRRHFSKADTLKVHQKICNEKEEIVYKCDSCPKSYRNKHSLIRHSLIHTGERNFKCEICDKTFMDKYAVQNHLKSHNSDSQRLTCDFCGKTYINKHSYQEHVMTHVTGIKKPYSCDKCDMNFTTKYQLKSHMNKHSENPQEKPRYDCKICNKKFTSLSEHMKIHSDAKPYICDVCDRSFRRRQNLIGHLTSHYDLRPFTCNQCGKAFSRKVALKLHTINMHTDRVKSHICQQCDKAFVTPSQLQIHMRTHTGEKLYKCDKCYKKFCELRGLKLHELREHTNVKKTNYICDLCNKVYLEKNDLIRHLKTHKGKRHFRCDNCNKSFLDMYSLHWHIKNHSKKSKNKPYCTICKKSFSNKLILSRHHFSRHDGYKEYACNICEKDFTCYQHLNFHIHKAHKDGFKCSVCLKMFSSQRNLLKHTKRFHGLK